MRVVMLKEERQLADWLRREFGAERFRVVHGGKHRRLWFSIKDRRMSYMVSDYGDPRAFRNATTQLRRIIGPVARFPRAYLDRTDEPPEVPEVPEAPGVEPAPEAVSRVWQVKMAGYGLKRQPDYTTLWFMFKPEVADRFPRVQIERLDDENWKLSRGPHEWSKYSNQWYKTSITERDVLPFGVTMAEAIETDGEILIYLAKDKRNMPMQYNNSNPWRPRRPRTDTAIGRYLDHPNFADTNVEPEETQEEEVAQVMTAAEAVSAAGAAERLFAKGEDKESLDAAVARIKTAAAGRMVPTPELLDEILTPEPEKAAAVSTITTIPMSPEERMRCLIREAREIEKLSPYRLIRDQNDRLIWRAPEIGEDD